MAKKELSPQPILIPVPAVMVSCAAEGYQPNIITISWIGIVNSEPPMLSISVTPQRFSYNIIKKSGDFVVNLTSENRLKEVDFCGTKSGCDYNKFETLVLTPVKASRVTAPLIKECPINLECQIKQSTILGTHEMFVAEIVAMHIDDEYLDERGKVDIDKLQPLAYCPGARQYRGGMTELLGRYGTVATDK